MEAAVILVRLLAFAAGAVLFGAPLLALYSPGGTGAAKGLRGLIAASAAITAMAAAGALVAQTGQMAGDPWAGLDPGMLRDVIGAAGFGPSVVVRLGAGLAALAIAALLPSGRLVWTASAVLGAAALAALAWAGHGAADEGAAGVVHAAVDIAHLLAAGAWLGALGELLLLLQASARNTAAAAAAHRALAGFAGVGSAAVAVIVASGLVNGWFLVGPQNLARLASSAWGLLLLVKLALFAGMLGFAAANRFRLTPALGDSLGEPPPASADAALAALRRSLALESALALGVLALVAVLGTLPPPSSTGS